VDTCTIILSIDVEFAVPKRTKRETLTGGVTISKIDFKNGEVVDDRRGDAHNNEQCRGDQQ